MRLRMPTRITAFTDTRMSWWRLKTVATPIGPTLRLLWRRRRQPALLSAKAPSFHAHEGANDHEALLHSSGSDARLYSAEGRPDGRTRCRSKDGGGAARAHQRRPRRL